MARRIGASSPIGRTILPHLAVVLLALFPGIVSAGNEARCAELGAACICSEPMNTDTYDVIVAGTHFGPSDTTTKECAAENQAGAIIADAVPGGVFSNRYTPINSGEAITALPAAHTNTWVLQIGMNAGQMSTRFPTSAPSARIAYRGYRYWSSDYDWTGQNGGSCLNSSKVMQAWRPGSPILDGPSGSHQIYGWGDSWNLTTGFDCCFLGPGPTGVQGTYNRTTFNGKWWRFEWVVRNSLSTGGVTILEIYRKNVTDNLAEEKIIDTAIPTTQGVGDEWTSTQATTLKPDSRIDELGFDMFRNGSCAGFIATMYHMAAAWDTDDGQFIGAASEIEGEESPAPAAAVVRMAICSSLALVIGVARSLRTHA